MSYKNQEINQTKVEACLQYVNVSVKDYLKDSELLAALEQLNEGPFERETFDELWDQCKLNSKGETKVEEFMEFFIKAEEILIDKICTLETNIAKLQLEKRPEANDYAQQKKFKEQLEGLREERSEAKKCLAIIRKPFAGYNAIQSSLLNQAYRHEVVEQAFEEKPENQLFEYDISTSAEILQKILYLTLILAFISWLGSQLFNRFIDLTVSAIILMGYACQAINRKIVKLNLILIVFSFSQSFLWLILYGQDLWEPSLNSDYPVMNKSYLRLSVGLIFLGQILKLLLCYYYLTQLHISQVEIFAVNFNSWSFFLQNEPYPPDACKHPLSFALMDVFNRRPEPAEEASSV